MYFTSHNAEIVACILLVRKSRHKPNLESTSKYGFPPDLAGGIKWRRYEHAHASYPGISFRSPGVELICRAGTKESLGPGLSPPIIPNHPSINVFLSLVFAVP